MGVADDILDLQRAFDEAELNADVARLGELLAEDFLSIGEQGFVLGKREWIGRHGEFRYVSIETSEVDVRRYGEAAVVRCFKPGGAAVFVPFSITFAAPIAPAMAWPTHSHAGWTRWPANTGSWCSIARTRRQSRLPATSSRARFSIQAGRGSWLAKPATSSPKASCPSNARAISRKR